MVMKKSIGRTLAHIDVAANTSVRIHEDFFNSHSSSHQQSGFPKILLRLRPTRFDSIINNADGNGFETQGDVGDG
jgi:hypothetical protein